MLKYYQCKTPTHHSIFSNVTCSCSSPTSFSRCLFLTKILLTCMSKKNNTLEWMWECVVGELGWEKTNLWNLCIIFECKVWERMDEDKCWEGDEYAQKLLLIYINIKNHHTHAHPYTYMSSFITYILHTVAKKIYVGNSTTVVIVTVLCLCM